MKTKYNEFFKDLAIRAIKTFFQSLAGTMTTALIVSEVDWKYALSASLLATLYCIAFNIGTNLPEDNDTELTDTNGKKNDN